MSDQIPPDTKNWTWVLERACPDCGFEAATFEVEQTGAAVRDLGRRWREALHSPDVAVRPRPDKWSTLEYGCHVRDVFRLFDERLARMLAEDDPHFSNWDQDKTALEDDYASQDPVLVADEVDAAAVALAQRYDTVAAAQWDRRGLRSDGSVFTVESLARYLMHDPVHHLWDVGAEVPTYST